MTKKRIDKRITFFFLNPKVYLRLLSYKIKCIIEASRGVDFTKTETPHSLNISIDSWGYETSGNKYLINVLKHINITTNDRIIDIGCGKGHALYMMCKFPFSKISGIELSKDLCEIAQKNMKLLIKKEVEIINKDATSFNGYDKYNLYYLYNPFKCNIMKIVISKIITSIEKYPRKVLIIYKNPLCHSIIIDSGKFNKTGEFDTEYSNFKFYIYSN